jgi:signal transduction histidine kinase
MIEAAAAAAPGLDERVLVLAPFASDTATIQGVLQQAGLTTQAVLALSELIDEVRAGAGVLLLTEEALIEPGLQELANLLAAQPTWSDLPMLLLLAHMKDGQAFEGNAYAALLNATPSVTLLRRPVPSITLLSAVQSALRARRRQYDVRDLIIRERQAREEAETATRLKDEFLASVTHELRTPVSAMLIWAKLLTTGRLNGAQLQSAVDAIVTSAEAQSRLIEDLLDSARMMTGKLRIEATFCQLNGVLQTAADLVRPSAQARGVELELLLGSGTETVQGDAQRLRQIFCNLLDNAIKFSLQGGVVSLRLANEGERYRIDVIDTGQGIEPEHLPYIFQRFHQAPQDSCSTDRGLGLGLSIVRQLVELHGGSVVAKSPGKGCGCTFSVSLPSTQ